MASSRIAEQRRRQILDAAAACFAQRGFHQTTMPEICVEAGMSPGSVYRYFRSKDQLIEAIVDADRAASVAAIEAMSGAHDVVAALIGRIDSVLSDPANPIGGALTAEVIAEATRNERIAAVAQAHEASVVAAIAEMIRQGQSRHEIDPELGPENAATFVASIFDDLTIRVALGGGPAVAAYASFMKDILTRVLTSASVEARP